MTVLFIKSVIISLLVCLGLGFIAQISLFIAETSRINSVTFAADGPLQYPPPPLYHLLMIPVVIAVSLGKRFWTASAFAVTYLVFHLLSAILRLQGCFLGEDICPSTRLWTKVVDRFSWFDWASSIIIPVVGCCLGYLVQKDVRERRHFR
jgi:hypothetical protein